MTTNLTSGLAGFFSDKDWPLPNNIFPSLFTDPERPSTPTTATSLDNWPSRAELSDELLQRVYDSICADAGCAPPSLLESVQSNVVLAEDDSSGSATRSHHSDQGLGAEEKSVLRLAATSGDWAAAFDATCALLTSCGSNNNNTTTEGGVLDQLKPTDLIYLCSSLMAHWPHVTLPQSPPIAEDPNASAEAQSLRNLCSVLQSLVLAGKRRVGVRERNSPAKKMVLATLAHAGRTAAAIEAFAPLFFECSAAQGEACSKFRSTLERWAPCGVFQHIFELFVLALARAKRWRALATLLACSRVGEVLVLPVMALKNDAPWLILPEAGEISGVRQEILLDLRFPSLAILAMLDDLCHTGHAQEWPFCHTATTIFQSVFPIICCRAYSDELLVHRGWHRSNLTAASSTELLPMGMMARLYPLLSEIDGTTAATPSVPEEARFGYLKDLDKVLTTFVFGNDVVLGGELKAILSMEEDTPFLSSEVRGWSPAQQDHVLNLWRRVHESLGASERYYSILELWCRICESFLLADKRSPVSELLELGDNTTRESVLETSRRIVFEMTGCDLTHIEIYLMRLLEAWESSHGIPSDLPGLTGPRKTFVAALSLSPLTYYCFLLPIAEAKLPPSAYCCTNLKVSPLDASTPTVATAPATATATAAATAIAIATGPGASMTTAVGVGGLSTTTTTTAGGGGVMGGGAAVASTTSGVAAAAGGESSPRGGAAHQQQEGNVYPTLLPLHVAEFLPAWFATRGTLMSTFGNSSRQYIGWRALCTELLAVSIMTDVVHEGEAIVAPHLSIDALRHFVLLYTDCANPRALHLLTRLTTRSECHLDKGFLMELLSRAKLSKFVMMADAIAQLFVFDESATGIGLSDLIVEVYLSACRGHDADLFLRSLGDSEVARGIRMKWSAEVERVIEEGSAAAASTTGAAATAAAFEGSRGCCVGGMMGDPQSAAMMTSQHTRTMRWRKAVQILKGMSTTGGVDSAKGAVALFHDLRKSPGGIPDISVANKVIHICITHGKLNEAEKLYNLLRNDAHQSPQGGGAAYYSVVRPDVVTCNILLKGLAKKKPPQVEEMERLIRQMETPFELGGDGITADQVTYNTMINAAVMAGSFNRAWEYLAEMRSRGIKVDGFTCSILMKQITSSTKPELIQEILQLLDDLDPIEDPVLLSSIVDVYSRLRDVERLSSTLDRYQQRVQNPTPYALATLVKGYGRCGLVSQANIIWQRLENTPDIQWSPYIFGCVVDCFVTNGDLDRALGVLSKATAAKILISDLQYSVLIRACTQRRRLHDALRLYKEMKTNGLQPCDVTYNNLMHLCVVAGDLETAVEILNDMTHNAHHRPDVVTYSTIIKGLCDRGAMKLAMQLFEDIPRRGVEPDVVAYNTLLEGFAKTDDMEQVAALYAQLLERNVKPTCYTLTILVKFYGRRHQLDKVLHLVETLPRLYAIRMDAFVYTATIAACTWNGRVDKAIGFLEAMRASFGASARTYGTLVAGCVRQQSWQPLSIVLKYAAEDNVILGKRDASSLHELLQEWTTKNIAHKWLRTGFDNAAAAQLKHFLAGQRAGVGSTRRGG